MIDANEGEKKEEKLSKSVPYQLTVQVFKGNFAICCMSGWCEAKPQNSVQDGTVLAVNEKDQK